MNVASTRILPASEANPSVWPAIPLAVVVIVALWWLRPLEFSDNSIHYMLAIRQASLENPPFYPPHLLHMPAIAALARALAFFDLDLTAAATLHSVLWAGLAAGCAWALARTFTGPFGATATALGLVLAHGFLVFAGQAEVYVPTVGASLMAGVLLVRSPGPPTGVRLAGAALFWAIATLYHTTSAFLAFPFLVWLVCRHRWKGLLHWLALSTMAGGLTLAVLVGAFVWAGVEPRTPAGFLAWLLEIHSRPLTAWGTMAHLDPLDLLRGGWNLAEALAVWPWALRDGLDYPDYQMPLASVVGTAVLAVLGAQLYALWRRREPVALRLLLLTLFAVWFLVFTWWDPTVHKFYIPAAAAWVLLASLTLQDLTAAGYERAARILAGAGLALLLFVDSFSLAELRRALGPYYAEAARLAALAPSGCRIYAFGTHTGPLAFYFDMHDTRYAVDLEREFWRRHHGSGTPGSDPFTGERCAFLMLGWLAPERFARVIQPWMPDARWEDYLAFVLRARKRPDGGIEIDALERLADGDDRRYLYIDRTRRIRLDSLDQISSRLRHWTREALARVPAEIPLTPDERVMFLLTPRSGFLEHWQTSERMFGYGGSGRVRLAVAHMRPPSLPADDRS